MLPAMDARPLTPGGVLIMLWSVGGVVAMLAEAIARLLPRALEPLADGSLGATGLLAYLAAMLGLAYSEGYRGFQQGFSPRVAARALHLAVNPRPWLVLLAPVYVMGLIHATRRRLIGSWVLLFAIVAMIMLVSTLAQPWRGAVDAGVIVGLSWGAIVTVIFGLRSLRGSPPAIDPDLPPGANRG